MYNRKAADLMSFTGTDLRGKRLLEVSPVHMRNGVFADYAQVVETRQPLVRELLFETRERKTWVRITASPLNDGLVALTEDIAAQKETEQRQNRHDQLLRDAQQAAGFGTWELDLEANRIYPSEAYCRLLGFEPDQMPTDLGDFLALIHPEDQEKVVCLVEECKNECEPFSLEHRMIAANGDIRYFILQGQALKDQPRKLAGIALDVTQLREIKQRLDTFRQVELLSEAIPHIVWAADKTGRTNFVNSRWEEYTGCPAKPLPKCAWFDVLHPDDQPLFMEKWLFCVAHAEVFEQEVRVKDKHGNFRWYLLRSVPYLDLAGNVLEWYGTGTDIQDQKEAMQALQQLQRTQEEYNAELNRKNEQLRKANADMDNFIYMASHDLKSPISNIQGLVQCLAEEFAAQAPGMEPILQHIQQSVNRFRTTLAEMSEVIVAERALEEPAAQFGLAVVIEELKQDLAPLLEATNGQIDYELEVPQVNFARKNMRSLLFNLLSNALKYHSPERPPVVEITTRPMPDNTVLLTVQDNGLGLSPENLSQAFTLFKRVHTHTEGSGMGLYLVKRMVENGGGRIEAESREGEGTVFRIYLPRG